MERNAWADPGLLDQLEGLDGLAWASTPMQAHGCAAIQPLVLRDGDGYQPRLMHADGRVVEFPTVLDFGTAYAQANDAARAWIKCQLPADQWEGVPALADDFAGLDGIAWQGEPVGGPGLAAAVPFVLHDREQFQPRLLHPDGGLALLASQPTLDEACRQAMLASEQWMLEQAAFARPAMSPELFDAEPVHAGPSLIVDDLPVDSLIRPVVTKDRHGRFHAQLYGSEPGLQSGDMYLVAGPFSSLRMAKDAALIGAFAYRLPRMDDHHASQRSLELRERALEYLRINGEWAAMEDRAAIEHGSTRAMLVDAANINRLLIQDHDVDAMLRMSEVPEMDRLAAVGIRAAELCLSLQHQLARQSNPQPAPSGRLRMG